MEHELTESQQLDLEKRRLEVKKLRNEVKSQEKPKWKKDMEFLVSLFQATAIILGVLITLREFVFKSSERDLQRKKSTIEFLEKKDGDAKIRSGYNFLQSLEPLIHDIKMVENDSFKERVYGLVNDSLIIKTRELTNFWNVIYNGVRERLFDADYCRILLYNDNLKAVEMIDEIQLVLGRKRKNKYAEEFSDEFKGLIEYYRLINKERLKEKFALNPSYHSDSTPMHWLDDNKNGNKNNMKK